MKECSRQCQNYYPDLAQATLPDTRTALQLRRYWWTLKKDVWFISVLGPFRFLSRTSRFTILGKSVSKRKRNSPSLGSKDKTLNLQPGEWVEVKTLKEIFATLDGQGKLRGLAFNKEMAKFCGGQFKVYRRLDKIILESTGELRKIRTPTVMLEGVFCDGKSHGGCDRSCFCFWREAWLRRISPKS